MSGVRSGGESTPREGSVRGGLPLRTGAVTMLTLCLEIRRRKVCSSSHYLHYPEVRRDNTDALPRDKTPQCAWIRPFVSTQSRKKESPLMRRASVAAPEATLAAKTSKVGLHPSTAAMRKVTQMTKS